LEKPGESAKHRKCVYDRPDRLILRRYFKESLAIGAASFAAPFVGAMLYAHYVSGWDWPAATICGIALSTTSVAVVYAVMIETGLNETDFGKLLLAACFVTDLGSPSARWPGCWSSKALQSFARDESPEWRARFT
jgi:hypothetical protein